MKHLTNVYNLMDAGVADERLKTSSRVYEHHNVKLRDCCIDLTLALVVRLPVPHANLPPATVMDGDQEGPQLLCHRLLQSLCHFKVEHYSTHRRQHHSILKSKHFQVTEPSNDKPSAPPTKWDDRKVVNSPVRNNWGPLKK